MSRALLIGPRFAFWAGFLATSAALLAHAFA